MDNKKHQEKQLDRNICNTSMHIENCRKMFRWNNNTSIERFKCKFKL